MSFISIISISLAFVSMTCTLFTKHCGPQQQVKQHCCDAEQQHGKLNDKKIMVNTTPANKGGVKIIAMSLKMDDPIWIM